MDWDKLRTFHAAAEAGSLTGAAEALGVSQSAVSRHIAALEEQLGASLFHRHARGLHPTEAGRLLHHSTADMTARLALAQSQLADSRDRPSGRLRVTAPEALGAEWLVPRLDAFAQAHPDIILELVLDDAEIDLSSFQVEVAIRLWRPTQGDLIQRRILETGQRLYASPAYLERQADGPRRLIAYAPPQPGPMGAFAWVGTPDEPAALSFTSLSGVKRAIEAGLGVGGLPDFLVEDHTSLVQVDDAARGPDVAAYLVYPGELKHSRRIAAFKEFLLTLTHRGAIQPA